MVITTSPLTINILRTFTARGIVIPQSVGIVDVGGRRVTGCASPTLSSCSVDRSRLTGTTILVLTRTLATSHGVDRRVQVSADLITHSDFAPRSWVWGLRVQRKPTSCYKTNPTVILRWSHFDGLTLTRETDIAPSINSKPNNKVRRGRINDMTKDGRARELLNSQIHTIRARYFNQDRHNNLRHINKHRSRFRRHALGDLFRHRHKANGHAVQRRPDIAVSRVRVRHARRVVAIQTINDDRNVDRRYHTVQYRAGSRARRQVLRVGAVVSRLSDST